MVNPTGVQHLEITDFAIDLGTPGWDFTILDIYGTIDFVNGSLQGITIEGYSGYANPQYTSVAIGGSSISLTDTDWNTINGTVTYGAETLDPPSWL